MPRKSKTKKVKEDKKKPIKSRKQKQKQKQSVNVNVHIDQSKRTHARQKQAEPVRQYAGPSIVMNTPSYPSQSQPDFAQLFQAFQGVGERSGNRLAQDNAPPAGLVQQVLQPAPALPPQFIPPAPALIPPAPALIPLPPPPPPAAHPQAIPDAPLPPYRRPAAPLQNPNAAAPNALNPPPALNFANELMQRVLAGGGLKKVNRDPPPAAPFEAVAPAANNALQQMLGNPLVDIAAAMGARRAGLGEDEEEAEVEAVAEEDEEKPPPVNKKAKSGDEEDEGDNEWDDQPQTGHRGRAKGAKKVTEEDYQKNVNKYKQLNEADLEEAMKSDKIVKLARKLRIAVHVGNESVSRADMREAVRGLLKNVAKDDAKYK